MNLVVKRCSLQPTYTIGKLFVDGVFFCNTLEDTDRGLDQSQTLTYIKSKKVYGKTAIPTGTYDVRMDVKSPKYSTKSKFAELTGGYMPRIDKVKGWEGVLIHSGNTEDHTLGCLLVGENTMPGKVLNSFSTFSRLYKVLKEACNKGDKITLTIERR